MTDSDEGWVDNGDVIKRLKNHVDQANREVARLQAQLKVLAHMYDYVCSSLCSRCAVGVCSAHGASDGLIEVTGRRFDGAYPDWPLNLE